MECIKIEDLISEYIENELPQDERLEVSRHLETCERCRRLKEKIERLMYSFPELEEEVPFFLKNRLYYIPESQEDEDNVIDMDSRRVYLKWVAAVIGTFVLMLNIFYFTNVYPPAHRVLHAAVSGVKTLAVKTEAIYEKVKESNILFFLPSGDKEIDKESEKPDNVNKEPVEDKKETKKDKNLDLDKNKNAENYNEKNRK
ncbi:MAG: hypothetical protein GY950_06905 [bacterium]|nr:hypothetical protein [bacterium]